MRLLTRAKNEFQVFYFAKNILKNNFSAVEVHLDFKLIVEI